MMVELPFPWQCHAPRGSATSVLWGFPAADWVYLAMDKYNINTGVCVCIQYILQYAVYYTAYIYTLLNIYIYIIYTYIHIILCIYKLYGYITSTNI